MATEFISTIKSTGGDYSTLASWESAIQVDLTAATTKVFSISSETGTVGAVAVTGVTSAATGTVVRVSTADTQVLIKSISGTFQSGEDVEVDGATSNFVTLSDAGDSAIAVAEISDDWPSGLSVGAGLPIRTWTTDTTNKVIVRAASADGFAGDVGVGVWITGTSGSAFKLEEHVDIVGLRVSNVSSAVNKIDLNASGITCLIDNCYLFGDTATESANGYGVIMTVSCTGTIRNNIIHKNFRGIDGKVGATFNAENCTLIDNDTLGVLRCKVTNCVAIGHTSADFHSSIFSGSSKYASEDSSGDITGITSADFEDHANDDFSLPSGSDLVDAGDDLSSSFTIDVAGNTRDATFDVGAFEYIAVGGSGIPILRRRIEVQQCF